MYMFQFSIVFHFLSNMNMIDINVHAYFDRGDAHQQLKK